MMRLIVYPVIGGGPIGMQGSFYPIQQLRFQRDVRVYCQIEGYSNSRDPEIQNFQMVVPVSPLPDDFFLAVCGDEGYTYVRRSAADEEITVARAGDMANLQVPLNSEDPNRAIVAFMGQLPPETPVLLVWE